MLSLKKRNIFQPEQCTIDVKHQFTLCCQYHISWNPSETKTADYWQSIKPCLMWSLHTSINSACRVAWHYLQFSGQTLLSASFAV